MSDPKFDLVQLSLYPEILHVFILVHDDIADRDLKRYGGPTLEADFQNQFKERFGYDNKMFGQSLAIIGGDLLHVLATGVLDDANAPAELKIKVQRHIQNVLHQVIAGWNIHFWQNSVPLSEAKSERYLKGMELVSASYTIQGPLEMGLILSGTQDKYSKILAEYGYHVGMAFQIQDDILGVFGDSKQTGKPSGNDIREGKKTLLVLEGYQKASDSQKKILEQHIGNTEITDQDLNAVKEIITSTNSLELSKQTAAEHAQKAQTILEKLKDVDPDSKQKLQELAEFVVARKY